MRTAWLFGPPGNDFPSKIVSAADALEPGAPCAWSADEFGSPTYTIDLAPALFALVEAAPGGIYHLAAPGSASRASTSANAVISRCRPGTRVRADRPSADFPRASTPPAWSVARFRDGRRRSESSSGRGSEALAEYASKIC